MKTAFKHALAVGLVLSGLPLLGGPAQTYWPLNNGDQRLFSIDGIPLAMTVTTNANGNFVMQSAFEGSSQSLTFEEDANDLYLAGVDDVTEVSLDNPPIFLDDDLLQSGGTVKTVTGLDNGLATVTISVTVGNAGTVKVPAGTFTGCKSIVLHVKKDSASSSAEIITGSSTSTIIAPNVGIIKTEIAPGLTAQLVNATIGGTFYGNSSIAPLTVLFSNGPGKVAIKGVTGAITSDITTKLLTIGQSYTATAAGINGSVFDGWSNAPTTLPKLTFTMQSNLVLEANFTPNPFASVYGRYIGLFMGSGANALQSSGYVSLTVSKTGSFSGYLQTGNTRHAISGQFDGNGNFTNTFSFSGLGPTTVGLGFVSAYGQMYGTVSNANGTSSLIANQLYNGKVAYSETGRYEVAFTDADSATSTAIMNFTPSGPTTLSGKLPDGTKFSVSSTFSTSEEADWPFYAPLYGGSGAFFGWMSLGPNDEVVGTFTWIQSSGTIVSVGASGQL
jgi:hypothetical protein